MISRPAPPLSEPHRQRLGAGRIALRIGVGLLLAVGGALPAAAQRAPLPADTTRTDAPERLLETLTEEDVSGDPTVLLELIEELRERPLDLNAAPADDLALIPFLSPRLAEAIVRHRQRHGPFGAVHEIERVEGITPELAAEILPFITLEPVAPEGRPSPYAPVPTLAEIRRGARADVLQRVQRRLDLGRGYDPVPAELIGTDDEPNRYLGSPERIYTRVRATSGRTLSANLTLEKDPGEPFRWDPETGFYGYDFASFHLAATRVGRLDALVVGDFVAEFGQGVALWRASGFGKGREVVRPLVKRGRGVRPYGSTDENRFFRGVAATVAVTPHVYASAFASRRALDARFNDVDTTRVDSDLDGLTVAGMPVTGLHRTRNEIAQKHALGQTLVGGATEVRLPRATLGVVGYRAAFDVPLAAGPQPYQRFQFTGDEAVMASVYGSAFVGNAYLFGEVARDPDGVLGGIAGVEGEIGVLDALVLLRHYPRDFTSLHGHAFAERNGINQNETGAYLGLRLRPTRQWTVSGFFDQYRFPWVRFGVPRPSAGHEALLFVEHRPRRWVSVYAQARTKTGETSARFLAPSGATLDGLTSGTRQSLRVQGELVASPALRFRSRIEGSRYQEADGPLETGSVLFQDVRWAPRRGLMLDARLTLFETDSFNARLYQFENDLFGVLTNTLLSGRGTRTYVMASVRPGGAFAGLDLRVKLAQTRYQDRHTVGSGLDAVEGDRVRDLNVQVRYRF